MQDGSSRMAGAPLGVGRREALTAMFAACARGSFSRGDDGPGPAKKADPANEEEHALTDVLAAGVDARLPEFKTSKSANYLAVGDASATFRELTLRDCEAVAADYLDYYKGLGFDIHRPEHRLIVVTLSDERAFFSFFSPNAKPLPKRPGPPPPIHGIYQPDQNRLIVYDHRALGPQFGFRPGYQNLRHTAHEATHQLTFNTGLLERKGDVPRCIGEGLAMYGEVRKFNGKTSPGENNTAQLDNLAAGQRRKIPWIPVSDLLTDDRRVLESQLGYPESWLLVSYLLKDGKRVPAFREYLAAIRTRKDSVNRIQDAREHLGDLDALDRALRAYAVKRLNA